MDRHLPPYRLVRPAGRTGTAPVLDPAQQAVVDHRAGPLLVLAGPGTGKTTAIVETVVNRITRRGIDPQRVLVLTFSRKAAEELRERITGRLQRTTREPLALTFHSYAYALVRREFVLAGDAPPTLLSGPEQLLEVRRMLRGEAEDGGGYWPERLRPALTTRGFAAELRDFLLRAAERGLDGRSLRRLGRQRGRDDWEAAGTFLGRYTARFDVAPVPAYDYAEIIRIAAELLAKGAVGDRERSAYDVVLVDEYQDIDPAQETMLHALAGDGRELIAVGDPDQSIYAFRGADVRAIMRFPDRFRMPDGRRARVIALRTCRRSGPVLLAASRRIAARLPAVPFGTPAVPATRPAPDPVAAAPACRRARVTGSAPGLGAAAAPGAPAAALRDPGAPDAVAGPGTLGAPSATGTARPVADIPVVAAAVRPAGGHRDLEPLPAAPPGVVRVVTAASSSQEAAFVADTLRRAHLIEGVAWSSMAVLVRSVTSQAPLLRRALTAAGVPSVVSGDELPLTDEPGAWPLLLLLRCALRPATLDEESAAELLTGPLGGTDSLGLRRLRRLMRETVPAAGAGAPAKPLVAALSDPRQLGPEDGPAVAAVRRVAGLLARAGEVARNGSAHDVLWAVWDASGLAPVWQAASAAGGATGGVADRDLDAVVALFDSAARFTERLPPGSPWLFLDSLSGQEIPGDTLAEQAPQGDAVRILTAHRAKGLEWDVVVVAGVQEGIWPDLRMRSSLLGMDELVDAVDGIGPAAGGNGAGRGRTGAARGRGDADAAALASKLLSEERRLWYVAATRARRMLVATAVSGEESGERPSRFLAELAGGPVQHLDAANWRWLSLPALTADLRRAAASLPQPSRLREAAAAQLARLAAAGVRGAHPASWYQLTAWSDAGPLAAPPGTGLMRISPSDVESFSRCGLRWLLEVAVGTRAPDVVRAFGTLIHAAAVLAATGADDRVIDGRIDEVWRLLDFGSAWYSEKERTRAHEMVSKFLAWHRDNPREVIAVEQPLLTRVGQVEITGRVDRLERDGRGRAIVVDLKTGSNRPANAELDRDPQLGVYQLAVLLGAFERFGLTEPGGAELVQVGKASFSGKARIQRQRPLPEDPEPDWARELVGTVAAGMTGPVFQARRNSGCRTCPVRSCCPVHDEGEQVTS